MSAPKRRPTKVVRPQPHSEPVLTRDLAPIENHNTGDHRKCGSGCPNSGKDMRRDLGIYSEVVKGLGNPFKSTNKEIAVIKKAQRLLVP